MGNIKTSLAINILLDTRLQGLQIGNIQIQLDEPEKLSMVKGIISAHLFYGKKKTLNRLCHYVVESRLLQ